VTTFHSLALDPLLLEGVDAMNFKQPTPIQEQAIPLIIAGKDVVGIAQTGTGKTAAFVLPLLHKIIQNKEEQKTKALIIVPTRELALQIDQAVEAYSYYTGASSIAIYGGGDGNDFYREKQAIVQGVDIIIATPGRLITHMNTGHVDFTKLDTLVLDEADRMLDMGFLPDLDRIVRATNSARQTLMFSATMPKEIMHLANSFQKDPVTISIALSKPAEGVTQHVYHVYDEQKNKLIEWLLAERKGQSILVFASTKQSVAQLYRHLKSKNLNVGTISSDLQQEERESVMLAYRSKQVDILVATDVVSRGIDIKGIHMVINFDVPGDAEDYVHRIGRTARADMKGEAVTLVSPKDYGRLARIEKLIGSTVPKAPLPEFIGQSPSSEEVAPRPKGGRPPFNQRRKPGNQQRSQGRQSSH
jgi:superfamily II DNA/RNA helicase